MSRSRSAATNSGPIWPARAPIVSARAPHFRGVDAALLHRFMFFPPVPVTARVHTTPRTWVLRYMRHAIMRCPVVPNSVRGD
eukprot:6094282-Pyramimonas_sp.AAC.1